MKVRGHQRRLFPFIDDRTRTILTLTASAIIFIFLDPCTSPLVGIRDCIKNGPTLISTRITTYDDNDTYLLPSPKPTLSSTPRQWTMIPNHTNFSQTKPNISRQKRLQHAQDRPIPIHLRFLLSNHPKMQHINGIGRGSLRSRSSMSIRCWMPKQVMRTEPP